MLALKMRRYLAPILWIAVAALGAAGFAMLALTRGENVSAAWMLVAGVASYVIAYRFYARFLALRVFALDDRRATPAERLDNGRDFVPTNKWVLFGHHFAAIAGAGPLVGPDAGRAVRLPARHAVARSRAWSLGGAVQDFVILFASMRRDGKSLGQMAKEEINTRRRPGRDDRHPGHHDHPAGGAGAGGGQRAEGEPLGRCSPSPAPSRSRC